MQKPKRVLCIMDMSCVGRAALSVALPVLAACGAQACGLPASLFSTHTGGFGPVHRRDEADFCTGALAHYAREDVGFDAVQVGYLFGQAQFDMAMAALEQYPGAFHLVDPALGDDGKLYGGLGDGAVDRMRTLCDKAQLITPNYTESALLCGQQPDVWPADMPALQARLKKLAGPRRSVLVTSVPVEGGFVTAGCGQDGAGFFTIETQYVPQRYPGTGDTFSSAVLGLTLGGLPLEDAARRATGFVQRAVHATWQGKGAPREGLWLEPFLPMLAGATPYKEDQSGAGEYGDT